MSAAPASGEPLEKLANDGFVDYVILPLVFTNGETHGASFATRAPEGFSEAHLADFRRVIRPLTHLVEIGVLRVRSTTLLNTYVGHNSGERILAGRIQKGDVETLRAVICSPIYAASPRCRLASLRER